MENGGRCPDSRTLSAGFLAPSAGLATPGANAPRPMPGIRRSAPAPRHLRLTPTVFRCRATIDAALLSRPMGNLAAVTVAAAAPRCSYGGNRHPQPNRPMKDGNRQADKPTSDK
ncbi:hypothetical protein GTC3P0254_51220 [Burkholderia pseudomallei]|nr:hypothetical protein GTC019_10580 [Burkholderia pseudomallei]BEH36015.1 hypothetical protein GTC254T_11100 [Burkholderia pseudomallei]BEH53931.1 hypothetical protein BpKM376_11100 [Burkholderia pseudomallei]BEH65989.1 hypothetical protein BpKM391_10640 [Burkholderia pseudomallei]GEA58145.1 hypothetical protein GTC3P0254_51220 [Burkholderia pseudomallei]